MNLLSLLRSLFLLISFLYTVTAHPAASNTVVTSEVHKQLLQAAMNGSASAQYELGLIFEYGTGVSQDDTVAIYWYAKSAEQKYTDAQYRSAVLYENGWGVKPDKTVAFDLYKLAASAGHELAQHDLAIMYFQGSGTSRNLVQAYKWLKIAVINGSTLMQKHLAMVSLEMSLDEIALANQLADHWMVHSRQ